MIDFKGIISRSNLYNFHSHTQFCDGRAPMEAFVVQAINEGFTDYGFSPHSPVPFESSCNMTATGALEYVAEFHRLREKYGERINLYMSMEIDYINRQWGATNPYFDSFPLDYRISAVHFLPAFTDPSLHIDIDGKFESFKTKMHTYFNDDIEGVVRSFYAHSIEMIELGGFDVIGHFDKIGHNAGHFREGIEDEPWYAGLVNETFDAIMDHHLIIEVNTKALAEHRRTFPDSRFYHLLRRYKAPLLINSDVHYTHLINAGRMETMAELSKMGLYTPAPG